MILAMMLACSDADFFYVENNGAALPVSVHGNTDSGEMLLYVQGGPGYPSIDMRLAGFVDWETRLEPHVSVAYYDQRGTGNTLGDYKAEDMDLDNWVSDLDAVATVLSKQYPDTRLTLLSHSFGGYLAARTLLETDIPADAWISINGTVSYDRDYIAQKRRDFVARISADFIAEGDSDAFWAEALAWAEANPTIDSENEELGGYLDGIYERVYAPDPELSTGAVLGAALWSHYNLLDSHLRFPSVIEALWPQYDGDDLRDALPTLPLETLVLNGSYDDIVPDEIAADVAEGLPAGTLHTIPGAGHNPFTEQPEAFGDAVLGFVLGE